MKKNEMKTIVDEKTGLITVKKPRKKMTKIATFCGVLMAILVSVAAVIVNVMPRPQAICDPSNNPEATLGGGMNLPSDGAGEFRAVRPEIFDYDPDNVASWTDYAVTVPTWVTLADGSVIYLSDRVYVPDEGVELPRCEKK